MRGPAMKLVFVAALGLVLAVPAWTQAPAAPPVEAAPAATAERSDSS